MKVEDSHMGKYAKIALVLLYVAQLAVLFKDELTHLYRNAVAAVHRDSAISLPHESGQNEGPKVSLFLKRASKPRFNPNSTLFALSHLPALTAVVGNHQGGDEHDAHPAHDDDKHKDRPKRHTRLRMREIIYLNLSKSIRKVAMPPSADEPRERAVLCAVMLPEGFIA